MATKIIYEVHFVGECVVGEEYEALTADQLREAIDDSDLNVFRRPDGSYAVRHAPDLDEYKFVDENETKAA